jgi:hypothetical protein
LSFGRIKIFSGIQEVLVLALMLISVLALFYVDMDIFYKIGIGILAFTIMFLSMLGAQILKQQKEAMKQAQA